MKRTKEYRSSRPSVTYPVEPLTEEMEIELPPGTRWGLCLSHDLDHLGLREHWIDGFLCRHAVQQVRENLLRRFRPGRAADRLWGLMQASWGNDRWDTLGELLEAERRAGVRSTWFIAARRGLGIAYGAEAAREAVEQLTAAGQEVGLHSQCPDDPEGLVDEINTVSRWAGRPIQGVRMHYLRLTREVYEGAARGGLAYDSTVMDRSQLHPQRLAIAAPRMVNRELIEIPLHVMDSTVFSSVGLGLDTEEALDYFRQLADRSRSTGRVLVLNLHPNSYSRHTPEIRDWYDGILRYAGSCGDVFLTDFSGLLPRIRRP